MSSILPYKQLHLLSKAIFNQIVPTQFQKNLNINDKIVLDPLTTICRLALLCYKPKQTRLAIGKGQHTNGIRFDEPKDQSLQRAADGSSREDLGDLDLAIDQASKL